MSCLFCLALKTLYSLTFYSHLYFSFLRSTPHPGQVNLSVLRSWCRALILVLHSSFCVYLLFHLFASPNSVHLSRPISSLNYSSTFAFSKLYSPFPLRTPNAFGICFWNGQLIVSKDFNGFKLGKMTNY